MGNGFGIAALILAILAIAVPVVGIGVSGLAIVLALVAAFGGDRMLSTAASLVALVNTFFLSPSIWLVLASSPISSAISVFLFVVGASPIGVVIAKIALEQSKGPGPGVDGQTPPEPGGSRGTDNPPPPHQPGPPNDNPSAPGYNVVKWRALVRFDDEIAAAAQQVRAFGSRWEDELARSYLALNDKGYLAAILEKILRDARAQQI